MDTPVLVDVFPATVRTPQGALDAVRLLSDGTRVWVFARRGQLPVLAASADMLTFNVDQARGRSSWSGVDADGGVWQVSTSSGCGCGNPLRSASTEYLLSLVPA